MPSATTHLGITHQDNLRAIADERADFDDSCDAIVKGCSAAYHSPAHDMTMNYADYFFIEAVYKKPFYSFNNCFKPSSLLKGRYQLLACGGAGFSFQGG